MLGLSIEVPFRSLMFQKSLKGVLEAQCNRSYEEYISGGSILHILQHSSLHDFLVGKGSLNS
jgi:hypothetical protein